MTSKYIKTYLLSLQKNLASISEPEILKAWDLLTQCQERGGTVWICGNGGSASLADHFAQDLTKQCHVKAQSLTSLAMITALGNDEGYEHIFSRQLEMYGSPVDLLIVISGSGNSPNILAALLAARGKDMETLAVLGFDGGHAKDLADHTLLVPAMHMGRSEDGHLILSHILVYGLMEEL